MPSEAIQRVVLELMRVLAVSYDLQTNIGNKESDLAKAESDLKRFARDEHGLS